MSCAYLGVAQRGKGERNMGMQVLKRPFALFCAVSFPAIAQAQAVAPVPSAAATPQDTPAAPAATPPDNSGIADIVVTATRREERLQNIPVTVTAIGGDALENSGVREVRSLTQIIPAFNGGRNQNVMQPSIRGVGSAGNSTGDESNVAIYVDGVYQADPYSTQIDLVQVERVEVLRGPQGTVFGPQCHWRAGQRHHAGSQFHDEWPDRRALRSLPRRGE
ncbi:Plug domain-containing protein [Novosphingobium sp. NBM11]|uniref:TonB-dependent receptor plug domain-containing protein n=1 Tax=Novosphingobium sp. NBM11 TaxID=2596914 RepID=UPI001892008F|nr:Plug domain-containing protein [Novosphingobium sp. NBM11]MBF5089176.1 Plug domain-containing protein [Novosphingobium sp. NBM11]